MHAKKVKQRERAARQKVEEEEAFPQLALEQRIKASNADHEFLRFVQQITEKKVDLMCV
jgi:hypothetical protein